MDLVIATKNTHKFRELRSLLKSLGGRYDLYSLNDFPEYHPPIENGQTFEENATLKAMHAAKALGRAVIADDSGLVVPALWGEPGVFSARYAGEKATDKENRQKLLNAIKGWDELQRAAYFECCLVLASPSTVKKVVRGICEGTIVPTEKGRNGFGYDSIFVKQGHHMTFGELEEQVKNQISHRAKAFEKLRVFLEAFSEN